MIKLSIYFSKLPTYGAWRQPDGTGFTIRFWRFGIQLDWPNKKEPK